MGKYETATKLVGSFALGVGIDKSSLKLSDSFELELVLADICLICLRNMSENGKFL